MGAGHNNDDKVWALIEHLRVRPLRELPSGDLASIHQTFEAQVIEAGANVAVFIASASSGPIGDPLVCGRASTNTSHDGLLIAVVRQSCLGNQTTLAHEVGHLLGARHEITDDPGGRPEAHAFRWPDWTNGKFIGTVMARDVESRVPTFARSDRRCGNQVVGSHPAAEDYLAATASVSALSTSDVKAAIAAERTRRKYRSCAAALSLDDGCWNAGKSSVFFEPGQFALPNQEIINIDLILAALTSDKIGSITLVGFADDVGTEESNLAISYRRALQLANHLTDSGPQPFTIRVCAAGESFRHCDANLDEQARRALERRVEILSD